MRQYVSAGDGRPTPLTLPSLEYTLPLLLLYRRLHLYHCSQDHGKKICVIENEFGAINIDTGLVAENMKVALQP